MDPETLNAFDEGHSVRFATRTDFGLRTLLYLALHPDRVVPVAEIAAAYDVSQHHLAKVAQRLGSLGWVASKRGQRGGLRLTPHGRELTLGDVVRAFERWELVECFEPGGGRCPIAPACGVSGALAQAQAAFLSVLDDYPLTRVAANKRALKALLPPPMVSPRI